MNDIKSFENRAPALKPKLDVKLLDPFPLKYEVYYNDHFNLRSRLIRAYNMFKLIAFKRSPMPEKVIIGSDGWLFQAGDDMNSFLGKNKLSEVELQSLKNVLEQRANYLERINCKFYLLIAPSKASIYSDKISYEFQRSNPFSWGEQLIEYLNNNSQLKCIDAFKALKAEKKRGELYHKLDNHWNDLGAFITSNEVIRVLRQDRDSLQETPFGNMIFKRTEIDSGNMQKMLGYLPFYKEVDIRLQPKNGFIAQTADKYGYVCPAGFVYPWEFEEVLITEQKNKPKLLLISDSFGKAIFPYLAEHFSKSVKIFDAWEYKLNENIVESEKPNVFILLVNEPLIRHILEKK